MLLTFLEKGTAAVCVRKSPESSEIFVKRQKEPAVIRDPYLEPQEGGFAQRAGIYSVDAADAPATGKYVS